MEQAHRNGGANEGCGAEVGSGARCAEMPHCHDEQRTTQAVAQKTDQQHGTGDTPRP